MKNLTILLLLLTPYLLMSQDTLITESDTIITNTGVIEVDQVEVIKAFEAKLIDAKQISIKPSIQPIIPVEKKYGYDITIVPVKIEYPDPIIKPLAMNPDTKEASKKFYSRIGYGDLKSPYADVSYHDSRGDEFDYTISGHFYGAEDITEDVPFRKFYESDVNLNVGYRIGENHKVNVDFGGGYDLRNLYDTVFTKIPTTADIDVKRNIAKARVKAGINNIETTDGNFNYGGNLIFETINFRGALDYIENGFGLDLFVDNKVTESMTLFLNTEGTIHKVTYPSDGYKERKAVIINPGVRLSFGNFQLDAAADIFIDDNLKSPFADIKASYSLLDNSLQIYAGVDQVTTPNTLWNHYLNNPFVSGFVDISKTTISKQYFGGVSGKLRDFLSFNFMGGYEDVQDQFYYGDRAGFRMFVHHTDMTNIFVNANIEFNLTKNVSLGANASQNFYSPTELDILPNLPEFKYSAYSKVKLMNEKLTLSTDLNLMDKISYINDFAETVLGNTQIDLSIGLDFYVTENFGLWLRGNNLLDRSYLRFSNYPEFGRNLLGGLLIKF